MDRSDLQFADAHDRLMRQGAAVSDGCRDATRRMISRKKPS